jgi:predicted lipoprotein with Yx(FWY)xxD motif
MKTLRSTRTLFAGAAIIAVAALALTACGSSGGSANTVSSTPAGPPGTVDVTNTSLGKVLVDAQGRTLYLFQKDSGTTSACTGQCATFWPPLTAPAAPTSGNGAQASLVGTTKRPDGTMQVTYNGHPVYLYMGDHNAGDTNGEGLVAFGGGWFALSASGNQVSPSSASNGGGGSGSGY